MRIRTVKPEFFNHEGLFEAERESGLPLRVAFCGLWCAADREGRFKWEPRRLGTQILPYDGVEFSRVLDALTTRGFLVKYACRDALFGAIPNFLKHQVVNNRESDSILPNPSDENCELLNVLSDLERVSHASVTREPREGHACKAEGKGREGNKEGKGKESAPLAQWEVALGVSISETLQTQQCIEAARLWITHKKEKKDTYKPTGLKITVDQWAAEFTCATFPAAVYNAIAKGWKGIYKPDNGHSHNRSSNGRASVVEQRNATLGSDAAAHASEARSRARAIDEANAKRFDETGLTPFDANPAEVSGESAGAR